MPDEERRCAFAARCRRSERLPGTTTLVGALLTSPAGMCRPCQYHVANVVSDLPTDVELLSREIAVIHFPGAVREMVTRSRYVDRLPIRLGVETLRAEIDYELIYWAEVLGREAPVAMRLGARVATCAEWIAPRVEELIELGPQIRNAWTPLGEVLREPEEKGGERIFTERTGLWGALRLVQLRGYVRVALGRTALVHRLPAPCPYCDHRTLVRPDGASEVSCEHCGKAISERHYDWFTKVIVAEEQRRAAEREQDLPS